MKRHMWLSSLSLVVLLSALSAPASRAGVDVSVGVNAPVGNNGDLFFSISSEYFNRRPQMVSDWGRRYPNPDDLAVFLQICAQSRQSPEVVFNYRRQGLSWYDVGVRVGLPVEVWYVPVSFEPDWPYSRPYKHDKKHKHDRNYLVRLSDRQVRDLVAVRMAHEYYRVPPEVAMDWRRGGLDVQVIMTREYRSRHRDDRYDDRHDDRYDDRYDDHDSDRGKQKGKKHRH